MRYDAETQTWWFRQSWLNDALGCNERGRRKIIEPEADSMEGDAASAGTAAHAAVEFFLRNDGNVTIEEVVGVAAETAGRLISETDIAYKSFDGPEELINHAVRCAEAWVRDIAPEVELGGLTEVPFRVLLFRRDNGVGVGVEGTCDYLPPSNSLLMDWKNAGRAFKQWEKQRADIQATTYCTAAVKGGLDSAWEAAGKTPPTYEWPMMFVFGNAIRGTKRAKGELVLVARTEGHEYLLRDILNRFVDMVEVLGLDRPWMVNPNYSLCSAKWCPWWDSCVGGHITTAEHTWKP